MPKHLHLKIFGDVQGVNFRWYARNKARELDIVGWVKNMLDGTVELAAEGEEENLKKFLEWCKIGPKWGLLRRGGARVDRIDEEWEDATGEFKDFEIR